MDGYTMIETVLTCPLGSKCEEIKDGKVHRCAWLIALAGVDPNTGSATDQKGCAMSWVPVLLVENSMQQRSTSAAIESLRNTVAPTSPAVAEAKRMLGLLESAAPSYISNA